MDLENTFDLFGRQILELNLADTLQKAYSFLKKSDYIQEKLKDVLTQVNDHANKTENLVNAIGATKSYIDLKNKRIVGVKPSIDKYDVVIKSELEEVLDSVIKFEKEYSDVRTNFKGFKKSDYKDLKKLIHNISLTESADKKQILDVKSKRISNVSKGIDKYDAIVKLQFDEEISKITTMINNNHTQMMNTVNNKIQEINSRISSL